VTLEWASVTKTLESRGKRRAGKVVKRLVPCDPAVTGQTEAVIAGGCQGQPVAAKGWAGGSSSGSSGASERPAMPPTMGGGSTEAGQGGPIVKALAGANAALRKPPPRGASTCAIRTAGGDLHLPVELRKRVEADPAEHRLDRFVQQLHETVHLSVCNSVGAALRAPSELR
jgi:hypothetical protein